MKKMTKLMMVAGALSFVATGALAASGLSICSTAGVPVIHVACGATGSTDPTDTPFPVPAGGCINSGKPLLWFAVAGFLPSGKGQCIFYTTDKTKPIARANVTATFSSGTVSLAQQPTDYSVDFNGYTPGTSAPYIKVTLSKNS